MMAVMSGRSPAGAIALLRILLALDEWLTRSSARLVARMVARRDAPADAGNENQSFKLVSQNGSKRSLSRRDMNFMA